MCERLVSRSVFLALLTLGASVSAQGAQAPSGAQGAGVAPSRSLRLLENRGQWPAELAFVGSLGGLRVGLHRAGRLLLDLPGEHPGEGVIVGLSFEGASPYLAEGLEPLPGLHHWLLGRDPACWVRGVRGFAQARVCGLYTGIDLVVREGAQGLEYDLLVAPEADLSQVVVRCEGILDFEEDGKGGLVLRTAHGPLRQPLGIAWQEHAGVRLEVPLRTRRIDAERFGFEVDRLDPALPLVIDPQLLWSTYLGGASAGGGSTGDVIHAVALDEQGNVTVVGESEGPGFPLTPGVYQHPDENREDVAVTKFRQSNGVLVYSTLIGGSGEDEGTAVAVDGKGQATVVGRTRTRNFPTTPGAFDEEKDALQFSAFVLRLSAAGDHLLYSTLLEATVHSAANGVALAPSGAAIVVGDATADYPTTPGAFRQSVSGIRDAFVTRLDPTGSSLEWSTFLGGSEREVAWALELAPDESVVVAGETTSTDFPLTQGSVQGVFPDVFVARLADDGSSLVWSSALGGGSSDIAFALAQAGDLYAVAGESRSEDFPVTSGAFQESFVPGTSSLYEDGFVALVDGSGGELLRATFLGRTGDDQVRGIEADASGVLTVAGVTLSVDFPTTPGAFDTNAILKSSDGFITRLDPQLSRLLYSTRLGGGGGDFALGMAMGATGRVTAVGGARAQFPTTPESLSPTYNGGGSDGFVTTLDLLLQGVEWIAPRESPACAPPAQLNATEMPTPGAQSFGFYLSGGPSSTRGWLVALPLGSPFGLASVHAVPLRTDPHGYAEIPFPLPPLSTGLQLRCVAFLPTAGCPGAPLAISNALRITVQ